MPDGTATPDPRLPDDPVLLKGIARELLATVREQQRRIDHLVHQVHQLTRRLYGPRADRLDPRQPSLFDDPPAESTPPPAEPVAVPTSAAKTGHGRKAIPADLPRETVVVDVPDAVKRAVGGEWVKIGEEVSEKLDYTPASLFVRRIVRPKYAVRFPGTDRTDQLHVAELPPEAMPKSKAAPGLVADV